MVHQHYPITLVSEHVTIDLSMVHELCGGSQKGIAELVQLFLSKIPAFQFDLSLRLSEKAYDLLYHVAHQAKSSLTFFRIPELLQCLSDLETAANTKNDRSATELVQKANNLYDQVVLLLKQDRNGLAP